jgi:hypothetical protein
MQVVGAEPGTLRRLVRPLAALAVLAVVVVAVTIWARQQDAARRFAEGRAISAEARAVAAEASLTALARTGSVATPVSQASEPQAALRHALDLVFEAYKDPSDGKLRALSDAFSPEALSFERTEAEHLISGGMHLAGGTPYQLEVLSMSDTPSGDMQITTHEVWTYDEVDSENRRTRCVREESEQTYALRRVAAGWLIQGVTLTGATRRSDC